MDKNLFNIYYINFPKVYEIKMMMSNVISLNQEITAENYKEREGFLKAKLGFNLMDIFKLGEAEGGGSMKSNNSSKVYETFEIKTTKSIILSEIYEKAKSITKLDNLTEGQLVKIDNVNLTLLNEIELRTVKFINSGALKGFNMPEAKGLDFNGLFNSMFKDYAYKILGKLQGEEHNNLIIKIPLSFENELESSYGIDDLFIGKVSIVGIYKGVVKASKLKNTFEYFQQLGNGTMINTMNENDDEIEESQYSDDNLSATNYFNDLDDNAKYHYIDLLSIVQKIEI